MLLGLLLALIQTPAAKPPMPKAEASKLAELVSAALLDARATPKLATAAKAWQAKYDFDSLREALRAGPEFPKGLPKGRGKGKQAEKLEEFGSVLYGFTFECEGVSYRYGVDVPRKYDRGEPAPLLIDPGHGTGAKLDSKGKADFLPFYRRQADSGGFERALIARTEIVEQIGTDGLRGAEVEEFTGAVFDAFFRDLCSRFAVDQDRVVVAGLSQTGFWSWELGHQRADRFAGIAPMSAVSVQQQHYLANFLGLSVHILHGTADTVCPIAQPRATIKLLEELGVRAKFVEVDGAGHDVAVFGRLHEGLQWIAEVPRNPYPKKIAKALQTTRQPWCYWLRFDKLDKQGSGEAGALPTASAMAEIDGQTVRITSKGVDKLSIALSPELVDLAQPVVIEWNGKRVHEKQVERDFATTCELALEKVDWYGTYDALIEL